MTNKPEKLKSLTADSSFFCLDFDGEFVAAGTADGVIEVWSTSSSGIQGDGDGSPETGEPESGTDTSATAPPQETDAETMDQVAAAPDAEPADAGTITALTDAGVTLKKDGDGSVIEANCRSAEITDDLLVKLGELPNLRSLILSDTKITDTQLSAVGKLSGMQNLDLRNCPATHKNEHHGRKRIVTIGPKGQAVLRRYLLRPADAYCFTPHDSERIRREEAHSNRGTPISYGNRPGSNRKRKPARKPGDRYTTDSYRRAIHRACDAAFPPAAPLGQAEGETKKEWQGRLSEEERAALRRWQSEHRWSPNRLRHSAGTEIRKRFGLEAAQVVLGHASAEVTQVYAERDLMKAVEVMREVG